MQFLTRSLGWAVGSRCAGVPPQCTGVVLATADGGASWSPLPAPPSGLDGVQFLDPRDGWTWGGGGAFATTDGGRAWSALPVPPRTVSFVDFTDRDHGWLGTLGGACGLRGCGATIYRTSDGGSTWQTVAADAGPGPAPVGALANLPWAVFRDGGASGGGSGWLFASDPGTVYVTADGGHTWKPGLVRGAGSAVAFAGSDGWVATEGCTPAPCTGPHAGDPADLYRSADGGQTWTWAVPLSQYPTGLAAVPGSPAAWVLAQPPDGTSRCDDRSCATEVAVVTPGATPAFHDTGDAALLRLQAISDTEAWAIGSIRAEGDAILHTSDGGASWQVADQTAAGYRPGTAWGFWNANAGWALGASTDATAVLRTADGGRTWTRVGTLPTPLGPYAHGGFPTPDRGWALSAADHLLRSADGGAHWTDAGPLQPCGTVENMGFASPAAGWFLADGGSCGVPTLYTTPDGGRSWAPVRPASGTSLAQVAFSSPAHGWALLWTAPAPGPGGPMELARTDDGGRSWRPVAALDPTGGWSADELLPVAGGVWVLGTDMTDSARVPLYVDRAGTVRGGFSVPSADLPLGFSFLSAQVGFMMADGWLVATQDGGAHWRGPAA